jgi:MFS family permease
MTITNKKIWLMWLIGASFFLIQYFPRLAPGIMLQELIETFRVSSVALGGLAFLFYIGYVAMQVPAGMLLDRYGSRMLIMVAALVCAVSCVLFAVSPTFLLVLISRFILGFGAAFAFIAAVKLATVWFPPERLGVMVGLTQGLGMLGAALGDAPLRHLMNVIGWRESLWLIAVLFVLVAVAAHTWLKKASKKPQDETTRYSLLEGFTIVLKSRQSWINALYVGMLYVPTVVFGEFWGVIFMEKVHHLNSVMAAFMVSLIFIGFGVGSMILGWFSDVTRDRRRFMFGGSLASLVFGVMMLYLHLSRFDLMFVVFLFGFANAGVTISYTLSGEINPRGVAGTSVAFANMASILVGALIQPLVGLLVEWHGTGKVVNGIHVYAAGDYQFAMGVLIVAIAASMVAACFIKNPPWMVK